MGSEYKSFYKIGDIITGNYYSKNTNFEVIGFIETDCSINYKNTSNITLNTYMLIPYPSTLWEVDKTNFQFESLLYFAMINCDLLPFVEESQILKNIKSISDETGFSDFSLVGVDNFQIQHIELLLFLYNFLLFLFVLFILGLFIKENGFTHNFLCLSIIGQGLNIFDLFIVDLLWWRNTKRVRLRKMPEKELYQNPKKHIEAFIRAFIMYLLIALIDGYILTLL